jgi:hypothetical protein
MIRSWARCRGRVRAHRERTVATDAEEWFDPFGQQKLLSCGAIAWWAGGMLLKACGAHDDGLGVGAMVLVWERTSGLAAVFINLISLATLPPPSWDTF